MGVTSKKATGVRKMLATRPSWRVLPAYTPASEVKTVFTAGARPNQSCACPPLARGIQLNDVLVRTRVRMQ